MKKKILIITTLLCLIGVSSCEYPIEKVEIEMDSAMQKMIIGKWEMFGKNDALDSIGFGGSVAPGMFITFYQDGSYTSNIGQETGYYIITNGSWLYFYPNKPHKDSTVFYSAAFIYGVRDKESNGYFPNTITDTLSLNGPYPNQYEMFFNDANSKWFHFIRLEDE